MKFNKFSIIFLIIIPNFMLLEGNAQLSTIKIVGGSATKIAKRKYLVSIRQNNQHFCGGSLISKRFVLSAAHCFKNQNNRGITVHAGTSYLNRQGKFRKVQKIIMPKSFSLSNLQNDVAVLKLSGYLTGANIQAIALCNSPLKAGQNAVVSGWGYTSENGKALPNQVRTIKIPIMSHKTCVSKYKGQAALTRSMFCSGKAGQDSCQGDSGGPLVRNGRLCGIVSWGFGCARAQYPGVYTSVNVVKKFINIALKK